VIPGASVTAINNRTQARTQSLANDFNLHLSHGRGEVDRPHVFNSSFIYTLPIGSGHRFAGNIPGWVNNIIGGWDLGLLTLWQSGANFTVSSGRATASTSVNTWGNYTAYCLLPTAYCLLLLVISSRFELLRKS
jgi:hypothetical protein